MNSVNSRQAVLFLIFWFINIGACAYLNLYHPDSYDIGILYMGIMMFSWGGLLGVYIAGLLND
jgi:hypothetical protein